MMKPWDRITTAKDGRLQVPASQRFWQKVEKGEADECWPWIAGKTKHGYGQFTDEAGAKTTAHRFSFRIHSGEIPEGHYVLHLCDNPSCVNPTHLDTGTQAENLAQAKARGRTQKGSDHWNAKLSEEDVQIIRSTRAKGADVETIADVFGISPHHVYRICAHEEWKHVN